MFINRSGFSLFDIPLLLNSASMYVSSFCQVVIFQPYRCHFFERHILYLTFLSKSNLHVSRLQEPNINSKDGRSLIAFIF
jgi:hypothetical protein